MKKLRIAWFSNVSCAYRPGRVSLSSYTTRLLYPVLSKKLDIELFSSFEGSWEGRDVRHFLTAFKRHKARPFDLFFYQFEDDSQSFFTRAHLGLMPGIVWFHDFFLTSDGPEPLLNSPWSETTAKFNEPERDWPCRENEYRRSGPQACREASLSFVPVFSSERDHDEYLRISSIRCLQEGLRSWHLPVPMDMQMLKKTSGDLPSRTIIFCGSPRIEHRAHKLLQAVKDAHASWKVVWLIDDNEREHAGSLIDEFGGGKINLESPRTPENWAAAIAQAQIAVHTHFSVYGHLNPYLPMSLAAGLPCVVSDFAGGSLLPDSLVFKIRPGDTEARELTMLLNRLEKAGGPGSFAEASVHAGEVHSHEVIASELEMIITESMPDLTKAMARWEAMEEDARISLLREALSGSEGELLKRNFSELGWLGEALP